MQRVADQLPADSVVDGLTDATPYACSNGGVFFTGHWLVTPPDNFDTSQFVADLPGRLGSEFAEQESNLGHTYPAVELRATDESNVSVTVSGSPDGDAPLIDILAMSRCAQEPSSAG